MTNANFGAFLTQFFHDDKILIALIAIALDFIFGVLAAFKARTFRLSYISDFARNDVLFKLVPYFILYSAALVAGHQKLLIPGIDLGFVAGSVYAALLAAWVGSILSSLAVLGFAAVPGARRAGVAAGGAAAVGPHPWALYLAGGENAAPPKD